MGNLKKHDGLNYEYEGWFIKFRLPFTIDNMNNSPYDIENTKENGFIKCFCGSDCDGVKWKIITEIEIAKNPRFHLFNSKEEALEKFHKLVEKYGKNLKFEDIFMSIHHCEIEQRFTYLKD